MKHLNLSPDKKEDGLCEFQRVGWLLVDATYKPVNALTSAQRKRIVIEDYHLLRRDLRLLTLDRPIPLILLKQNICSLLESKLVADGFRVLNRGRVVYFPSHGRQKDFQRQFGAILKDALLPTAPDPNERSKNPPPTMQEDLALDLIFGFMGESRINRTIEDYEAIIAKLPRIKVLHGYINDRLKQLTENLPYQLCYFKAGDRRSYYADFPKSISIETVRSALVNAGMRTRRIRKPRTH